MGKGLLCNRRVIGAGIFFFSFFLRGSEFVLLVGYIVTFLLFPRLFVCVLLALTVPFQILSFGVTGVQSRV